MQHKSPPQEDLHHPIGDGWDRFVRFEVPYDPEYKYEYKTYTLKLDDKGDSKVQKITTSFLTRDKQDELVKEMVGKIGKLPKDRRERAKDFFIDFKAQK